MTDPRLKTSQNIVFYVENNLLVCDLFLDHKQISLSPDVMPFLVWLNKWKSYVEIVEYIKKQNLIQQDEVSSLIQTLLNVNVIVEENSSRDQLERELGHWNEWGMSSKYYHFSSKGLDKDDFIPARTDADRLREKHKEEQMPSIFKEESEYIEKFPLPIPKMNYKRPYASVLLERQTIRTYNQKDCMSLGQLSELLYAVWGAQSCWLPTGLGSSLIKTSPSGGSRHSIEVYIAVMNVEGLPSGYYHYSVLNHELKLLSKSKKIREEMVDICGDQPHTGLPSVMFFYTSVIKRVLWKYSISKAYKSIFMDLGHLSQTLYLTSSAMNLGCFFTAALKEDILEDKLNLRMTDEIVLGVSGVGLKTDKVLKNKNGGRFVRDDVLNSTS